MNTRTKKQEKREAMKTRRRRERLSVSDGKPLCFSHYFHSFNKNRQKQRKLFPCSFSVHFVPATPYTQVAGLIMHLKCSIKCLEDARSIISALAYKTVGSYSRRAT